MHHRLATFWGLCGITLAALAGACSSLSSAEDQSGKLGPRGAPADAVFHAELTELRDAGKHAEAFGKILRAETPERRSTGMDFAHHNVLDGSGPAAYAIALSAQLWDAGQKDKAGTWYGFSFLRVIGDATRCVDQTAAGHVATWLVGLNHVHDYVSGLPLERRRALLDAALQLDAQVPERRADHWYCIFGAKGYQENLERPTDEELAQIEAQRREGKNVVVIPNRLKPTDRMFVDDATWAERRQQIRDSLMLLFKF